MNPEKITSNSENNETELTSGSKWSILESLAGKYDAAERDRVDQLKDNLRQDPLRDTRYRYEQISAPPSILRKIGRLALDRLGIHFSRSETRRNREAMATAVREYDAEVEQEALEYRRSLEIQRAKAEKEANDQKEVEAKKEKEALDRDLIAGMDRYRRDKTKRFQKQRIQEQLEQDLNQRLLTVDILEDEVLAENPEVEKSIIEYESTKIPVYTLKGIPFSMISHDIEYRSIDAKTPEHIGVQTSRRLVEDPSIWVRREDEVAQEEGYGTRNGNAKGNVISASYINSESNLDNRVSHTGDHADICYGFAHLDGGELLYTSSGDGGTSNLASKNTETLLERSSLDIIDSLEGPLPRAAYNEFLLRRYFETGEARRPDYIIAENGEITEGMLKHAAFFDIPIINIDKAAYMEKMENKAIEALESINENSGYEEISAAIDKIRATSKYHSRMTVETDIGNGIDKRNFDDKYRDHDKYHHEDEVDKKIIDLGKLELEKRVDFIADELQKAIEACKQATAKGEEYHFASDSIAEIYKHDAYDFRRNKYYTSFGESPGRGITPADSDVINFDFRMKGSPRMIKTTIYDGERRDVNRYNREYVENSNSSYYDKVHPLIMAFLAAERENQEMITRQKHKI